MEINSQQAEYKRYLPISWTSSETSFINGLFPNLNLLLVVNEPG